MIPAQVLTARSSRTLRNQPWSQWLKVVFAVLVPMVLAGFVGTVVALGSSQLSLIAVGAVGGLALLCLPTPLILQFLLWLSFVGVGLAMYYGRVNQAHWLPYALCLCLWLKVPIEALARVPSPQSARDGTRHRSSAVMVCIGLLAFAMCLSAAVNQTSPLSALIGTRDYFLVWSVTVMVAGGALTPTQLRNLVILMVWLVVLQAPFAVQQHFMNFASSGSFDSVVGTFGGDPEGGGASGGLVLFLVVGLGFAVSLWRYGEISLRLCLVVIASVVLTTMMAEVKAFFVFAPLVVGVVLVREFRRRPAVALTALFCTLALLGTTLLVYKATYFDSGSKQGPQTSLSDYLEYAVSADSDVDLIVYKTGEVSRVAAPLIWLKDGGFGGLSGRLIGYGPRASMFSSALGFGDAAKRFKFNLNTSTVTVLLWDLGLAGLVVFGSLLCVCAVTAWRLSAHEAIDRFHRAALEGISAAFVLALASLLYNDAVLHLVPLQVFYAFSAGYIVYWSRQIPASAMRKAPPVPT